MRATQTDSSTERASGRERVKRPTRFAFVRHLIIPSTFVISHSSFESRSRQSKVVTFQESGWSHRAADKSQ